MVQGTKLLVSGLEREYDGRLAMANRQALQRARRHLEEAREIRPAAPAPYQLLAQSYEAGQDWHTALVALEQAMLLAPERTPLHFDRGLIYEGLAEQGEMPTALASEKKFEAWTTAGLRPAILAQLGDRLHANGHHEAAKVWYTRILDLQEDSATSLYYKGLAYKRLGKWEQALLTLEQVVLENPDNQAAWYELGHTHMYFEEWQEALRALERGATAKSGDTGLSTIYYWIGFLYQHRIVPSNLDTALIAYHRALEINDYQNHVRLKSETYHQIGSLYASQKRWQEALDSHRTAIQLNPNHYASHLSLAIILQQLGQTEKAKEHVNRAIALRPIQAHPYLLLAELHLEEGSITAAQESYRKVLQLHPDNQVAKEALERLKEEQ